MKVLFTGADGYVGALLGPYLLERGIDAVGLDTGFYRQGWLFPMQGPRPAVITKDLRNIDVANVVASAPFTISLMKRFGYRPEFAGGVEATSSMGGQIMPPVMGAVAFIMAETLNVPYIEICKAAAIPAILYFVACFWMVHLEAGRLRLMGLPPEECPSAWRAIVEGWYLVLPLIALVWLLLGGYTPLFSGMVGLALTASLVLGMAVSLGLKGNALRIVVWVVLSVACAGFVEMGVSAFFAIVALLVAACFFVNGGRKTLRLSLDASE